MIMAWIESHQSLQDNPKTRRAARALQVSIPCMVGHLHCLWWWALEYAPDGDLTGYDPEDIADAAMWEGDPAEFVSALINCRVKPDSAGFIECAGQNLSLHDWWEYAGKLIERRQRNAARMKQTRATDVLDTCDARAMHVSAVCEATVPIPNHTDTTDSSDKSSESVGEPRTRVSEDAKPSQYWTGRWVDAMAEADRPEPTRRDRAVFGRKVLEIPGGPDPPVMEDTLKRMVAEEKRPELLGYVYDDCRRAAQRELERVNVGGRHGR